MRKGSRFYWSWIVTFWSLCFTPVGYGYPSYSPGSVRFLTLCRGTQRWGKFWLKLIRIHEKINYLFVCAFRLTVTGLSFRPGIVERGKELARERENHLTRENLTGVVSRSCCKLSGSPHLRQVFARSAIFALICMVFSLNYLWVEREAVRSLALRTSENH